VIVISGVMKPTILWAQLIALPLVGRDPIEKRPLDFSFILTIVSEGEKGDVASRLAAAAKRSRE
jgi:hypothetical protein